MSLWNAENVTPDVSGGQSAQQERINVLSRLFAMMRESQMMRKAMEQLLRPDCPLKEIETHVVCAFSAASCLFIIRFNFEALPLFYLDLLEKLSPDSLQLLFKYFFFFN